MLTQKKYNEQLKRKEKKYNIWRNFTISGEVPKDIADVKQVKRMKKVKL